MKKTCSEIKDLIYLYGDGELSESEMNLLRTHISQCSKCYEEYNLVMKFKKIINISAAQSPELNSSNGLLERIVEGIKTSGKTSEVSENPIGFSESLVGFWEQLMDILCRPNIRFGMVLIILILSGTFLFQSSITFSDISKLENKMQSYTYSQSTTASVFDLEKISGNVKDFYLFLKGDHTYLNISSHLMIVDRDQFRNFFRIHNQLLNLYNKNPREFSMKYPELTRLLLEKIDPAEFDSVMNNGDLFSDLNKILKGESK